MGYQPSFEMLVPLRGVSSFPGQFTSQLRFLMGIEREHLQSRIANSSKKRKAVPFLRRP
jgi:hypothetical protein